MLIKNGKVLTMTGKTIDNGFVNIENGKITAVGRMNELDREVGEQVSASESVLDVQGAWVTPGLIDAHCHVGIAE